MDRLAWKSTSSRTASQMIEKLDSLGGHIACVSSRENIQYMATVFNQDVAPMMELVSEAVRDPLILDEEILGQVDAAAYEISEVFQKPDLILPEMLHVASYQNNTLGNPALCPIERLPEINRALMMEYRNAFYRPENIVVAFAGVSHEVGVKLAEKYFGDMRATPEASRSAAGILSKMPFVNSGSNIPERLPSHYTGGLLHVPPPDVQTHLPQHTHMYVAFEGLPLDDPDIYALATLQTLLGGGGSFSSGGPGKGMFSRLYTNVLNNYSWVESAVAFNYSYTDSGLFGIAASCHPDAGHALIDLILQELKNTMATNYMGLQDAEVQRAKNQLRSNLLMNLESRMTVLEDLAKQAQVYGKKISALEMCKEIEKLKVADIRRVAKRVLNGKVENVGQGTGDATILVQARPEAIASMGDLNARVKKFKLGT